MVQGPGGAQPPRGTETPPPRSCQGLPVQGGGHNRRPATAAGSSGVGGCPQSDVPKVISCLALGVPVPEPPRQCRLPRAAAAAGPASSIPPAPSSIPPSRIPRYLHPTSLHPASLHPLSPRPPLRPHLPPIPPAFRFPSPIPPTLRFSPILRAWRWQSPAGRPGRPPATPLSPRHLWLGLDEGGCAGRSGALVGLRRGGRQRDQPRHPR